uniref:Eukaryotic translation initiation factor 3 subunit K n=1 Tax=Zosterops lateralis melanops TaxID=1220523 RepID=A0A8D2QR82_ZOSLA
VTAQILLKALTNLPHTDFTLCKCMIDQAHQEERPIRQILYLGELLETCHFQSFWQALDENMELLEGITGFEDSVRKCEGSQLRVWMSKYGWTEPEPGRILISNQEENIKPKNIVEKIDFDSGLRVLGRSLGHPDGSLGKFGRSWRVLRGFWGIQGDPMEILGVLGRHKGGFGGGLGDLGRAGGSTGGS